MGKWNTKTQIISALRQIWSRHPCRAEFMRSDRIKVSMYNKDGSESKRKRFHHKCSHCGFEGLEVVNGKRQFFPDHIEPVIPLEGVPTTDGRKYRPGKDGLLAGNEDWNNIVKRMFNEDCSNIQKLCKSCHDGKTKEENKIRRLNKGS